MTVRGDEATVKLNDQKVGVAHIQNAARGPVGLLGVGAAIEFANIYVRELK